LVEPVEITTPELASTMYSEPTGFSVKAAEIHHIPELQCFGYTFQEPMTQPRPLNIDEARKLGVSTSDSFRLLKSGFSVMNDDKSRLVHPDEVCGQAHRPRKITVLGDCSLVPPAMEGLAMKSDVLVHEATLSLQDSGKKATMGGHSTAAQAAIFANKVKAQVLILNHLPKTLNTYVKCKEWLNEAETRIRGPTRVQLGYDHFELLIPRNGFNFNEVEASQSIWPDERRRIGDTIERIPKVNGNDHVQGWR
jgi:ribonuclease BN (tRNA processing enzyme)